MQTFAKLPMSTPSSNEQLTANMGDAPIGYGRSY